MKLKTHVVLEMVKAYLSNTQVYAVSNIRLDLVAWIPDYAEKMIKECGDDPYSEMPIPVGHVSAETLKGVMNKADLLKTELDQSIIGHDVLSKGLESFMAENKRLEEELSNVAGALSLVSASHVNLAHENAELLREKGVIQF